MDAAQLFIIARSDAVFYCRTPAVSLANNNESASGRPSTTSGLWRRLQTERNLQAQPRAGIRQSTPALRNRPDARRRAASPCAQKNRRGFPAGRTSSVSISQLHRIAGFCQQNCTGLSLAQGVHWMGLSGVARVDEKSAVHPVGGQDDRTAGEYLRVETVRDALTGLEPADPHQRPCRTLGTWSAMPTLRGCLFPLVPAHLGGGVGGKRQAEGEA
jgi:hypothetical protein